MSSSNKGEINWFLLLFIAFGVYIFIKTLITEVCKGSDEYAKGICFKLSVDGNGNSGWDFKFNIDNEEYEGFSLTDKRYPVRIGDTIIVRYCSDNYNVSEIEWDNAYMNRYKAFK